MRWLSGHSQLEDLSTEDSLEDFLKLSEKRPVVLFKHSRMCGSSFRAQREMQRLATDGDVIAFRVVVQRSPTLSSALEERLGVRHESPQVIIVHRARAVFNASHGRVRGRAVRTALDRISAEHE